METFPNGGPFAGPGAFGNGPLWGGRRFGGVPSWVPRTAAETLAVLHFDWINKRYWRGGRSRSMSSAMDFARASAGVYLDDAGERQTAAADVPRFTHHPLTGGKQGLLIENARANAIPESRDMTAGGKIAQAGTLTGTAPGWQTFTVTNTASQHRVFLASAAYTAGVDCALSAQVRYVNAPFVYLLINDTVAAHAACFNLSTGEVSAVSAGVTASIEPYSDGSYLIAATVEALATTSGGNLQIGVNQSSSASSQFYTGADQAFELDEYQFEVGPNATSRIRTGAAPASRAADLLLVSGAGEPFEGWDIPAGMTFVLDCYTPPGGNETEAVGFLRIGDGTNARNLLYSNGTLPNFYSNDANGHTLSLSSVPVGRNKVALAFDDSTIRGVLNGGAVQSVDFDLSGIAYDRLSLGSNAAGTGNPSCINAPVRQFTIFPGILPDVELQALTA